MKRETRDCSALDDHVTHTLFTCTPYPLAPCLHRRKRQRESKKQRKEAEVATRDDEIKRLKNLKKKEIEEKWVSPAPLRLHGQPHAATSVNRHWS